MSHALRFVSLMSDNALPYYRALTAALSGALGRPVELVEDGRPWQQWEQDLYRGEIDLGVICGLQYVLATDRGQQPGVEPLTAAVMAQSRYTDSPVYFSDVVVRVDSRYTTFAELRGARWAYNEPTSQSGYGITRYTLAMLGETRGYFRTALDAGSHLRTIELVLNGTVDAGAIDSAVLEQELRTHPELADQLRVVETLGPSPIQPLVASRMLPEPTRAEIRRALLSLHECEPGRAALALYGVSRYAPVSDADYDPIRHMARISASVPLAVC